MRSTADVVLLVFIIASVTSVGFNLTVAQIVSSLPWRTVVAAIGGNFVIVPLCAVWISKSLSLDEAHAAGLILLGTAAGAPFLPMLIETASGDVAASVALTMLLLVVSPFYLPLVLPRIIAGISVDAWPIARSLIVSMIVPLAAALFVKARHPSWAARLLPTCRIVSRISLAVAIILIASMHFRTVGNLLGSHIILASLIFMGVCFGIGNILGGRSRDRRQVLGLGTVTRNYSVAILIGSQSFENPEVLRSVLIMTFLALAILIPAAVVSGRHRAGRLN